MPSLLRTVPEYGKSYSGYLDSNYASLIALQSLPVSFTSRLMNTTLFLSEPKWTLLFSYQCTAPIFRTLLIDIL